MLDKFLDDKIASSVGGIGGLLGDVAGSVPATIEICQVKSARKLGSAG